MTFVAYLQRAKIPIQIDIASGDIVTPAPSGTDDPTLLGFPGPHLLAYSKETVAAEKLEALVKLGIANTRMKVRIPGDGDQRFRTIVIAIPG